MRKLHKTVDINEGLQKLEQLEQERFEKVQAMREQDFKTESDMNEELDTAFYFSVVFNTRKERDEWLNSITLNSLRISLLKLKILIYKR